MPGVILIVIDDLPPAAPDVDLSDGRPIESLGSGRGDRDEPNPRPVSPAEPWAAALRPHRSCVAPHQPRGPALATILTGRDVFAHGLLVDTPGAEPDPAVPTLAELVAARGVETDAILNPPAWLGRGFDRLVAAESSRQPGNRAAALRATVERVLAERLAGARPFLLFIDAGEGSMRRDLPSPPPVDDDGDASRSADRDAPLANDRRRGDTNQTSTGDVARLLALIAERISAHAAVANVHVVVTGVGSALAASSRPTERHTRVPYGYMVGGAATVEQPEALSQYDLCPTILDALVLFDVAIEQWLPGVSRLPGASVGVDNEPLRDLLITWGNAARGWRTPRWLLTEPCPIGNESAVPAALFDLGDVEPHQDVAAAHPEIVAELRRRLRGHVRRRLAETGRDLAALGA